MIDVVITIFMIALCIGVVIYSEKRKKRKENKS